MLRKAGMAAVLVMMFIALVGWVKLVALLLLIERHERMLLLHAGGLVSHEERIHDLESRLAPQTPAWPLEKRITYGDLACAISTKKSTTLLELYATGD
jgi:hypothetical protein